MTYLTETDLKALRNAAALKSQARKDFRDTMIVSFAVLILAVGMGFALVDWIHKTDTKRLTEINNWADAQGLPHADIQAIQFEQDDAAIKRNLIEAKYIGIKWKDVLKK